MKKLLAYLKKNQYQFRDREYRKFYNQAMLCFYIFAIVGALIMGIWSLVQPDATSSIPFTIVMITWVFLIAYCMGAASTIESADRYLKKQAEKQDIK